LATGEALAMLRAAKAQGLPVTVETCPHYLTFSAEEIPDGATLYKCAPPLRSAKNREEIWAGLREGVIDLVATDHSPCPPAMKKVEEGNFRTAWGGIAGISVALPAMWTEALKRGFGLTDIAKWMAEGPAKLAGFADRKGKIASGMDADFVVFDTELEFVVGEENLHFRNKISPYLGKRVKGAVRATYLRGECIFVGEEFPGEPRGKELRM